MFEINARTRRRWTAGVAITCLGVAGSVPAQQPVRRPVLAPSPPPFIPPPMGPRVGAPSGSAPTRDAGSRAPAAPGAASAVRKPSEAAEAPTGGDARLSRQLSVTVRAAEIGDVVAQLAIAASVPLLGDPDAGGRRITLHAERATLGEIQSAVASLYQTRWESSPTNPPRYRLAHNRTLEESAEKLRRQRSAGFLSGLLQIGTALRRPGASAYVERLRAAIAARNPELPRQELDAITPEFLGQADLAHPLRTGMGAALLASGAAWAPYRALPGPYQQLFAGFFAQQLDGRGVSPEAGDGGPVPLALRFPQARLEYALVYGDRWTGSVLLTRVGAAERFASAVLPSSLLELPDFASLYPDVRRPIPSTELNQSTDLKVDPDQLNWDQAIETVARAAKLNVLTDSYPRPEAFRPAGAAPALAAATVGGLLDRMARYYGYVWWKQGSFYVFRHRLWAEEERVAAPEPLVQAIGAALEQREHLQSEHLGALGSLSPEQLLSLHLQASAAGRPLAPPEGFNYSEMQSMQAGLGMFAQMTPQQQDLALGTGLPFALLAPDQQQVFVSMAQDRDVVLNLAEQERWRFRVSDSFSRQKATAGWIRHGRVELTFDHGGTSPRKLTLSLRVPAPEPREPKRQ